MTFRRSLAGSASVLAAALALAACGSSGSPSSSSHAGSSPASTSTGSVGLGNYHPVTDYTAFIGGHAGKADASKSPIYIGVINQQGGSADIAPQWTNGAQVAADFINNDAGGIDGHPVKLVECFIPDQVSNAQQCGQEIANNPNVQATAVGPVAIGNEAMESALAPTGKMLVWGISVNPVDTTYKNGYILYGDATHVEAPLATFIKQYLHSKSVAIVYPNLPGSNVDATITEDALKFEGVPVKVVGFDPTTTNLTGPLIASGAATAGLLLNDAPGGPMCSNIYKAVKQLNITTPVLANVPCDSALVAQADGGQLPTGWYYATAVPLPGDSADPSLPAFKQVADQFGQSKYATDAWVGNAFGEVMTIAKYDDMVLTEGKTITAANLKAVAETFKGPVPLGAPSLVCGSFPQAPAVCNDRDEFFQNTAPGVFKAVARWIGPPTGFQIPAGLQ